MPYTMNNRINTFFTLMACFLVLLSCACDPCDGEPGAIEIDGTDRSAPELYWQIVTLTTTPDGPISSLFIVTEPDFTYVVTKNDVVTVTLFAEDNQSGVKWMDIQGGFGYTCGNANGAIIFDGIIPGNQVFYDLDGGDCALAEGEYPEFTIDGTNLCTGTFPVLTSGGYELNGAASNSNGLVSANRLTINVLNVTI